MGAGVLVFVLLVTVIGWSLPTRDLSAIIVGVFAVFAYTTTMFGLLLVSSIAAAFSGIDQEMASEGSTMGKEPDNPYTNDVWFLLAFGVLLTVVWAAAWWVRGHDGYRALVLAMLTTLIPAATLALAVEHPSRWGVVVAALGALGIVVAMLRAVGLVGAGSPARR